MANVYKNELVDLTTTDNTTIYTTPASSRAIIKSIIVSEDAGSGSTITFTITNAATAVFNLFKDKAIASKATTELLTHPLILEENEVLKAQAADANELHVDVFVKPIRAAEFIRLQTIVTTTGVSFEELISRGVVL